MWVEGLLLEALFVVFQAFEMVKLFIGNLPREATEQEIRSLFEQYGKVLECDIIKNYGFVHIEDKTAAEDAIRNLHHYKLHGVNINVEASKNKSKASTKLHVGNISPTCTNQELRAKFEEYGPVIECDIVKDYAFVHMERAEDAVEAIRGLDNTEFQGELGEGVLAAGLPPGPGRVGTSSCFPLLSVIPWACRARFAQRCIAHRGLRDPVGPRASLAVVLNTVCIHIAPGKEGQECLEEALHGRAGRGHRGERAFVKVLGLRDSVTLLRGFRSGHLRRWALFRPCRHDCHMKVACTTPEACCVIRVPLATRSVSAPSRALLLGVESRAEQK